MTLLFKHFFSTLVSVWRQRGEGYIPNTAISLLWLWGPKPRPRHIQTLENVKMNILYPLQTITDSHVAKWAERWLSLCIEHVSLMFWVKELVWSYLSGATIKRIQQQTHTYIVTPSRDKEPVFEVTGMPENVDRAREEIEAHIALRTGTCGGIEAPGVDNNDFQFNGTDVSFETSAVLGEAGWLQAVASSPGGGGLLPLNISGTQRVNSNINNGARMSSNYRNDSSSSLGSGTSSADSFYSSGNVNRLADVSPTGPFNANANNNSNGGSASFWFGEGLLPVGSEELVGLGGGGSSSGFDPLTISTAHSSHPTAQPHIWSPFVDHQPLQAFDALQSQVREI